MRLPDRRRNSMTPTESPSDPKPPARVFARVPPWARLMLRALGWIGGLSLAVLATVLLVVGVALAVAYPQLPEIASLTDYRPKLPMRVYSADGVLLGEFGEERRNFVSIQQIPKVMQDAVLAAEDAKFYKHSGVNYVSVIRA